MTGPPLSTLFPRNCVQERMYNGKLERKGPRLASRTSGRPFRGACSIPALIQEPAQPRVRGPKSCMPGQAVPHRDARPVNRYYAAGLLPSLMNFRNGWVVARLQRVIRVRHLSYCFYDIDIPNTIPSLPYTLRWGE
jgi:hypothetical protein